jgi:hypothetical protein
MTTELQNTAPLSPALRALALGLLIETGVTRLSDSRDEPPVPDRRDEGGAGAEGCLWQAIRYKCGELSALVLRAERPGEAASYVLRYLPKHFDYVFEQLFGQLRRPVPNGSETWREVAVGGNGHETRSA